MLKCVVSTILHASLLGRRIKNVEISLLHSIKNLVLRCFNINCSFKSFQVKQMVILHNLKFRTRNGVT